MMSISTKNLDENLITAKQAAELLNCSRSNIEFLQLKGLLKPVPTIYPVYYFDKRQVIELKEFSTAKKTIK